MGLWLIWRFLKLVSIRVYCKGLLLVLHGSLPDMVGGMKTIVVLCSLVKLRICHIEQAAGSNTFIQVAECGDLSHTRAKTEYRGYVHLAGKTILHLWLHHFKFSLIIDYSVTRLRLEMCSLFSVLKHKLSGFLYKNLRK